MINRKINIDFDLKCTLLCGIFISEPRIALWYMGYIWSSKTLWRHWYQTQLLFTFRT